MRDCRVKVRQHRPKAGFFLTSMNTSKAKTATTDNDTTAPTAKVQAYAATNGLPPATATGSTTTAQRLDALTRIEKQGRPAKTAKIQLRYTLEKTSEQEVVQVTAFSFSVPPWVAERLNDMKASLLVRQFVSNSGYLDDPEHGAFTRARMLSGFEEIMSFRHLWAERDKAETVMFQVRLIAVTAMNAALAARFLKVDLELLLLAIVTHSAMTRSPNAAPAWSDMAHLHAAQDEA